MKNNKVENYILDKYLEEQGMSVKDGGGFNIGDVILIERPPDKWSSHLAKRNPLAKSEFKNFPLKTMIVDIRDDHGYYMAMSCNNGFGWDLSHLIKTGNIKLI